MLFLMFFVLADSWLGVFGALNRRRCNSLKKSRCRKGNNIRVRWREWYILLWAVDRAELRRAVLTIGSYKIDVGGYMYWVNSDMKRICGNGNLFFSIFFQTF